MHWLTIGISGVTCGGKTTLANELCNYLTDPMNVNSLGNDVRIKTVRIINQDAYFWPIDHPNHTWIHECQHINWEIMSSLNIDKMYSDIHETLGKNYKLYNSEIQSTESMMITEDTAAAAASSIDDYVNVIKQQNHPRHHQQQQQQQQHPQNHQNVQPIYLNILIIEGFIIFNHPPIEKLCRLKFHIHLPYEKCYERRSVRVYDPPDVVGYFDACVWPSYLKHYKNIKSLDDLILLNGELTKEKCLNYVLMNVRKSLN